MIEKAYAKLNISLDVVRKMNDGYHDMRMVMQSISLCDEVDVTLDDSGTIKARTNLSYLPDDDRNIAVKAAQLFFDEVGMKGCGGDIRITKRIPVCAGLGGGSSDGAAVLRALNRMTGSGLSPETLRKIASRLGSDVAFCVVGGTMLAEGRGDILTQLPPLPDCGIVICKPEFSISTPKLFAALDCEKIRRRPDTESIVEALGMADLSGVARRMYNVFEDILPQRYSDILSIKTRLLDYGALGVTMTGTGSAVFGLYRDAAEAREVYGELQDEFNECFFAVPERGDYN